jgi:hypothetical protein
MNTSAVTSFSNTPGKPYISAVLVFFKSLRLVLSLYTPLQFCEATDRMWKDLKAKKQTN